MITGFRPRLRTVLLVVNLAVVALPLGGIFFFRIYENQLVQQTESELISQAAVIAAAYRQRIVELRPDHRNFGIALAKPLGPPVDDYYTPIMPQIDFAKNELLPPRPDGLRTEAPADPTAIAVGEIMSGILVEAQKTTLAGLKLLDYNGVVVAGRSNVGESFHHVHEVERARIGLYTSVIRQRVSDKPAPLASISRGTGIRVFIAMPVIQNDRLWGIVYLSRTPRNIFKHLYDELNKVIFAALTILGLTLLLVFLTAFTISRPIHQLIARTRLVSGGALDAMRPLEKPGTREMELLSRSFADMARSLHERSQYIRDFATHVSHEFKTPLTAIQGAAELLHEHFDEMSDEEKTRFLQNIVADSERLKLLVTGLLELARADNAEPSVALLDVAPALRAMKAKYDEHDIAVIRGDVQAATIGMSSDNFDMIFSNLLENSRQHGATRVRIDVARNGDRVEIGLADDGTGVPAANRQKIFTPFFTTRREQGGTGLGLGIVKSILDAHKGQIELADTKTGTTFIMTLPVTERNRRGPRDT
jgi:signal transduction histidine kinase